MASYILLILLYKDQAHNIFRPWLEHGRNFLSDNPTDKIRLCSNYLVSLLFSKSHIATTAIATDAFILMCLSPQAAAETVVRRLKMVSRGTLLMDATCLASNPRQRASSWL
jgi:hypothetical protein